MTKETKLKDWVLYWLEQIESPKLKRRTYQRYLDIILLQIIGETGDIGDARLEETDFLSLQAFINAKFQSGNLITGKGLAYNTVKSILSILKLSLDAAVDAELIPENPARKVRLPNRPECEVEIFSLVEQKRIENVSFTTPKENYLGVALCLYTGLRLGELLALRWEDIDFRQGTLKVTKTACVLRDGDGAYRIHTDKPKTKSSNRVVPIPTAILLRLKAKRKKSKSPYVICTNKGTPVSNRSYQKTFEVILKKAKVSKKCFHTLRHTFATRALECGMDIKTLSELMGHKTPAITMTRYAHSTMENKKKMINIMGKMLVA